MPIHEKSSTLSHHRNARFYPAPSNPEHKRPASPTSNTLSNPKFTIPPIYDNRKLPCTANPSPSYKSKMKLSTTFAALLTLALALAAAAPNISPDKLAIRQGGCVPDCPAQVDEFFQPSLSRTLICIGPVSTGLLLLRARLGKARGGRVKERLERCASSLVLLCCSMYSTMSSPRILGIKEVLPLFNREKLASGVEKGRRI